MICLSRKTTKGSFFKGAVARKRLRILLPIHPNHSTACPSTGSNGRHVWQPYAGTTSPLRNDSRLHRVPLTLGEGKTPPDVLDTFAI